MAHPRLLIQAGTSLNSLVHVNVNSAKPLELSSPDMSGELSVRIADFKGPVGSEDAPFPSDELEDGVTWSFVIRATFNEDIQADDLMWGNCWEKPIRDYLPYGTSAALKAMSFIDPGLTHDLYADKPWALSPYLATMNKISSGAQSALPFTNKVAEDVSSLLKDQELMDHYTQTVASRKSLFNTESYRKDVIIPAGTTLLSDFCNGYIDFSTLSLKLPGGLRFGLANYWDGQPVIFVCKNKKNDKSYFYVTLALAGDEAGDSTSSSTQKPDDKTALVAEDTEVD